MTSTAKNPIGRYGIPILATVFATVVTHALRPMIDHGIMSVYFASVMVSAWYGGLGPGLLATGLSILVSDIFFFHPTYSLAVNRIDDLTALIVFSMVSFLINLLNNAQTRAEEALIESKERLRLILDGALDAVVSIDPSGIVTDWNPQAEKIFAWSRPEAVGKPLAETVIPPRHRMAHQAGLARFLSTGESAVLNRRFEITGLRRDGSEFPVELAVVPVRSRGKVTFSAFLRDITDRKRYETELKTLNENLEARVKERTTWLSLLYDVTRASNEAEAVGQAFRHAVKRMCADGVWQYCHVYLPVREEGGALAPGPHFHGSDPALTATLREATAPLRFKRAQGIAGRVFGSGEAEWVADLRSEPGLAAVPGLARSQMRSILAFPVRIGQETVAVVECFTDHPVERIESLLPVVTSVGLELGQVVERKRLQEGYTEAVWQQQRRIAHELHDTLGQELTGLGFLTQTLAESLEGKEEAATVRKVKEGIGRALDRIRGMAKGVLPVELDAEGLMSALTQLAASVESATGIPCRFECRSQVLVDDNQTALHLYRIAQEAVTNAVKHARPGRVELSLESTPDGVWLRVEDDGKGIAETPPTEGSGLRIMKYRAAAIGAGLRVEKLEGSGTRVTCLLPPEESNAGTPGGED
jgi:PAS domain S-box-containing protein